VSFEFEHPDPKDKIRVIREIRAKKNDNEQSLTPKREFLQRSRDVQL